VHGGSTILKEEKTTNIGNSFFLERKIKEFKTMERKGEGWIPF
jgi:hypothetical protein